MAFVAYAAILAFAGATDYLTDYFDPLDLGPLVLSLVGIVATLLAFVALQRYLAKRLPARRVRHRECPSAAIRSVRTSTARAAGETSSRMRPL